jgi:3-methyl-2-oxobutanoate hydroxymethyltransferase
MSIYGYSGTVPVTMEQVVGHAEAVRRGAPNTFIIGDMPFGSYQLTPEEAVANAIRFHKEAGVDAIKLEGGVRVGKYIKAIVDAGMNVMGHIGLTPQSSGQLGGFKAQGQTAESAMKVIEDALAVEAAGAFALLVEAVPPEVTAIIAKRLKIPVLSIGAGPYCDGQLLLDIDLLGRGTVFSPKFVKVYVPQAIAELMRQNVEAGIDIKDIKLKVFLEPHGVQILKFRSAIANLNLADITRQAFKEYILEVKNGIFPDLEEHCYKMLDGEMEKLNKKLAERDAEKFREIL